MLEVDRCDFNGAERLAREAEGQQRIEQQRRLEEVERARVAEEKRKASLVNQAKMWQRAMLLRSFVDSCEATLRSIGGVTSSALEWPRSARGYADLIDPLQSGFLQKETARLVGANLSRYLNLRYTLP